MIPISLHSAEPLSEAASPPLDENIAKCIQDKVSLGLCVHKEMLNYIKTKKLDFTACCQIVEGITADCYPFVTTDPIFGLIYDKFCSSPAPASPQ